MTPFGIPMTIAEFIVVLLMSTPVIFHEGVLRRLLYSVIGLSCALLLIVWTSMNQASQLRDMSSFEFAAWIGPFVLGAVLMLIGLTLVGRKKVEVAT